MISVAELEVHINTGNVSDKNANWRFWLYKSLLDVELV